jgi:hypothetical protein
MKKSGLVPSFFAGCLAATLMACKQTPETQTVPAHPEASGVIQSFSPEDLNRNTLHRRGVEAAIWGMPAVNFDRMFQAMICAHGGWNQILYWSRLSTWKNQLLTPNPDALYALPFFNTKDVGPVVLEIPPADGGSIVGSIMDCWQIALEDVGPAGVDKGKGGKYLTLPPGYKEKPPAGYIVLPSSNYEGYALLRSNLKSNSDDDIAAAAAYMKRVRLYPLSAAAHPPDTIFVPADEVLIDATIPYNQSFFDSLNRVVQYEPWLDRDRAMIDQLKSIGIQQGKPFLPDSATSFQLKAAIDEGHAWLINQYETAYPKYYSGAHWFSPGTEEMVKSYMSGFAIPDIYPVDFRGVTYYWGFSSVRHLGAGQFYLLNAFDRAGQPMDGSSNYVLHVPANVPVSNYWSITAYSFDTHALIRDVPRASRSSLVQCLQTNSDGTTDIYFGPKVPQGKDSNWIPTKPGERFEALFRFYGPERAALDKTWILPDIEKEG